MTMQEAEIKRLLVSSDERDKRHIQQAIRDAEACRELRRVSVAMNVCTCFCCTLDRTARAEGMTGLVA